MIEINLIPPELRKRKKRSKPGGVIIPLEVVIGAGGGLIILLVFFHFVLLGINLSKLGKYKGLQKEFAKIKPDKDRVDAVLTELRALQGSAKAINEITGSNRILWSQKLNILSDSLPRGVWLKKVALNDDVFFVEGSAISRSSDEMINVHTLTSNLKSDANFRSQLSDLELGSIQRRKIDKVEIADFLLTADVKLDQSHDQ